MSDSKAMEFVATPTSKPSKHVSTRFGKKLAQEAIEPLGSLTLIWFLIRRHRVGLLFNIVLFENAYLVARYLGLIG
jgi:hypothetical protein